MLPSVPHGAPQPYHHLTAPCGRQGARQLLADLPPERLQLARRGWIVTEQPPRGAHGAQRQTGGRHHAAIAHAAQLQAGAAEIRHHAVVEVEAIQRRVHAEPRFVAGAEHLDLDALVVAQGAEQLLAVAGVANGGGRHRDHPWSAVLLRILEEELAHREQGVVDGRARQPVPGAAPEPRGHAVFGEDAIARAADDAREQKTDGRRSEVDHRHQLSVPSLVLLGHGLSRPQPRDGAAN